MSDRIKLHPITPHQQRVFEVVDRLRAGAVVLIPTDSQYALACMFSNKKGVDRIRNIRNLPKDHMFTLIIDGLNGVSRFGKLSDANFKLIRRLIPGPYTFVLPGTKEVPKLLMHERRKTIGIKVPDHAICQKIIQELGEPLMAVTAKLPDREGQEYLDTNDLYDAFQPHIDVFIDDELPLQSMATTVVDLTNEEPIILRKGEGMDNLEVAFAYTDMDYNEI
ncbi:MAG: threonylcarbamoyl-AMP synthase [Bacteroidetes bacterium]|nr:threonylcarbamoyl-AMP synthase [Bacteroidota bacterium]MCH8522993.1 threonylcarbamoyl-AMP synthase [Balneolales bacterium]